MAVKILIVEDEVLIAEDLEIILSKKGHQIVGKAYNYSSALDMLANRNPELVLLDIALGNTGSGIDLAKLINEKYQIPFVFITSFSDSKTLEEVKQVYPSGYLVKPFKTKDIIATIEIASIKVQKKEESPFLSLQDLNVNLTFQLTPKEYEILTDLARGMTNEQLCDTHHITINTVKTHLKRIYQKLDVVNRSNAILQILKR